MRSIKNNSFGCDPVVILTIIEYARSFGVPVSSVSWMGFELLWESFHVPEFSGCGINVMLLFECCSIRNQSPALIPSSALVCLLLNVSPPQSVWPLPHQGLSFFAIFFLLIRLR